jgi:hypothetical protein
VIELDVDDPRSRHAQQLVNGLMLHHAALLTGPDMEARNAVVVKMVALVALAFGIPPDDQDELDVDDAIDRLRIALDVIARKSSA